MLKKFERLSFLRFGLNVYIRYCSNNMLGIPYTNQVKRDIPIIVSLSSNRESFDNLELSLFSIFMQQIRPDKVILWISDEYDNVSYLPYSITKYIKNGLEIRFVAELNSYTNLFYSLKEYPESIVVTAEDNVIYPKNWLRKLYHSYIVNPQDIHVHLAHNIRISGKNDLSVDDESFVTDEGSGFSNFIVSSGGVLYPPKCFVKEVFRKDIFQKLAPEDSDIWIWTIALVSNRKIRVVKNHNCTLKCADFLERIGLVKNKTNLYFSKTNNKEKVFDSLMDFYGSNVLPKLKIKSKS